MTALLRFALYTDLLFLFGFLAWPVHARAAAAFGPPPGVAIILACGGVLLSAAAFWLQVAMMGGTGPFEVAPDTLRLVLFELPVGNAFMIRAAALAATVLLAASGRHAPALGAAGIAVATLAWSGHAAATVGGLGNLHRAADVVHLLAASTWLGALAVLSRSLARPLRTAADRALVLAALGGFAVTGSLLVASLLVSGAINLASIVGTMGLLKLPLTPYGLLLITKLALFGAMLGLAAANRWWLTPRLRDAGNPGSVLAIRASIIAELSIALLVLGAVAWLGMLDPQAPISGDSAVIVR